MVAGQPIVSGNDASLPNEPIAAAAHASRGSASGEAHPTAAITTLGPVGIIGLKRLLLILAFAALAINDIKPASWGIDSFLVVCAAVACYLWPPRMSLLVNGQPIGSRPARWLRTGVSWCVRNPVGVGAIAFLGLVGVAALLLIAGRGDIVAWAVAVVVVAIVGYGGYRQRQNEVLPNTTGRTQVIVRQYQNARQYETDARRLVPAGWHPAQQSQDGGHINLGRTVTGAALTGGISLLFGGSRSKGKFTVTWIRDG